MESCTGGLLKLWVDSFQIVSFVEVLTFNRKQAAVLLEACPAADVQGD